MAIQFILQGFGFYINRCFTTLPRFEGSMALLYFWGVKTL